MLIKKLKKSLHIIMTVLLLLAYVAPTTTFATTNESIVPIDWSTFTSGSPTEDHAIRMKDILLNTNKYALTSWYNVKKNYDAHTGDYLNFGGSGEINIRPAASMATSLGVSIATGAYDASVTGISLEEAKTKAIKLIRSVAHYHKANGGTWGDAWQSFSWAKMCAIGAWMLWDELTPEDQQEVSRMLAHEANRFINNQVPYYRDPNGNFLTPGDSKAEENAWNAEGLAVAINMMPNHENKSLWMQKCIEYTLSAFAKPSDLNDATIYHGKPLSQWLNGSNVQDNGLVINHGRIHPNYQALNNMVGAQIFFTLTGQATPQAALFGFEDCYQAFAQYNFSYPTGSDTSDPNVIAHRPNNAYPGGSIYKENQSAIYYPKGTDWGTGIYDTFTYVDAAARAFGYDNLITKTHSSTGELLDASYWEDLHATKWLSQQNRFADGHTYIGNSENTFGSREEVAAYRAAKAYLVKWIANQGPTIYTNEAYGEQSTALNYECENLPTTASTSQGDTQDASCSNGAFNKLNSTDAGEWISYALDIPSAGTYSIKVKNKTAYGRGIYKLTVDTYESIPTDQYEAITHITTSDLGTITFDNAGINNFRFTVTGKNPLSRSYKLAFDAIILEKQ